jgi:hypothetical protein
VAKNSLRLGLFFIAGRDWITNLHYFGMLFFVFLPAAKENKG